jgi:hypothetical protein
MQFCPLIKTVQTTVSPLRDDDGVNGAQESVRVRYCVLCGLNDNEL